MSYMWYSFKAVGNHWLIGNYIKESLASPFCLNYIMFCVQEKEDKAESWNFTALKDLRARGVVGICY